MKIRLTGLEQTALKYSKTTISQKAGTKSGTLNVNIIEKYPELREVIAAWPELPEHVKQTIIELVQKHSTEKK